MDIKHACDVYTGAILLPPQSVESEQSDSVAPAQINRRLTKEDFEDGPCGQSMKRVSVNISEASDDAGFKVQLDPVVVTHQPLFKLMSEEQVSYLTSYGSALLNSYRDELPILRQQAQPCITARHPDIKPLMRAKLVDWVLHCTKVT